MPKNVKSTKKYKVNSHKVGNSTMITIPKEIVKKAPWVVRDGGNVSYKSGVVTITKPKIKKTKKKSIVEFAGIFKAGRKITKEEHEKVMHEAKYGQRENLF